MANTFCFCIGLRPGTIIISVFLLATFLLIPFFNDKVFTFYTNPLKETEKPMYIDGSPQRLDYIFAVFLPVVTFAMLLSAILRKSEILFYAMITFIVAFILLTLYSSLGEEKGSWFQFKFPATGFWKRNGKLYAMPKPTTSFIAVILYIIGGYFMHVVYLYVEQLRQDIQTSGQIITA